MPTTRPMTPFYRFAARGTIIPFLKMVPRQTVSSLESIPHEGGFIAMANYLIGLDSLTAMRTLVDADVPVYSLARSTLFKVSVFDSILRTGGQIPVQRGIQNAVTTLRAASEVLTDGGAIMIFPEGTLFRDPLKWPVVAKTGAARLTMISDTLVPSMGQQGAHEILDTYRHSLHPFSRKDVHVTIGELMDLSRFGQDTQDREAMRTCTAEIMRIITALVEELRGGRAPRPSDIYYDGDPDKKKIGVHRPDLLPEADAQKEDQ